MDLIASADQTEPAAFPTDLTAVAAANQDLPENAADCLCAYTNTGLLPKPFTKCSSFIECFEGRMVEETSCPDNLIFDSRLQACNWKDWEEDLYGADWDCEDLLLFQNNTTCQCEYAETLCTRSLQGLTVETILAWVFPDDCVMANAVCLIGDALF